MIPRPSHFLALIPNLIRSAILHTIYNQRTIAVYFRKRGAQIGDGCSIKTHSLGSDPYLVRIGNHVFVAEGVVFRTRYSGVWIFREEIPDIQVLGPIIIEDNCIIGQSALLLPNIRIGRNTIVEPGSMVNSDIPPNSVVEGVPAKVIGSIYEYKERYIAGWKEQKPHDIHIEEGHNWWNSKHLNENNRKLRRHLTNLFFKARVNGGNSQKEGSSSAASS